MTILEPGTVYYNKTTGKRVTISDVTEHKLRVRTDTGFEYLYPMYQFLTEYTLLSGTTYDGWSVK